MPRLDRSRRHHHYPSPAPATHMTGLTNTQSLQTATVLILCMYATAWGLITGLRPCPDGFFCHNTFGSVQTSKEVQILKPLAPVLNVGAWVHCGNKTQHTLIIDIAWNYPFCHGNSTSLLLKGDLDVSISSDAAQYPHYLSCFVVPSHNALRNVPWHGT